MKGEGANFESCTGRHLALLTALQLRVSHLGLVVPQFFKLHACIILVLPFYAAGVRAHTMFEAIQL